MTVPRVFVLGAGRAGRGLAAALGKAGIPVVLHGRRAEPHTTPPVGAGPVGPALAGASAALIAVRDGQLDQAVRELLDADPPSSVVFLHLSGGAEPAMYAAARQRGHPCGTFHPLLPLADPAHAAALFRGAWVGIDGDAAAREVAGELAAALGAHTLAIPANRALYHAAAVIASNFLGVLMNLAADTMRRAGVPPDDAGGATRTLLLAAAENLRAADASRALTGPVARGDVQTVRAHLEALAGHPDIADAYRALTRRAVALARDAGTPGDALDAMMTELGAGS